MCMMPDDTEPPVVPNTPDWTAAWLTPEVAQSQALRMKNEYLSWRNGTEHEPFSAFESLARKSKCESMVDIGCGAGIYGKLFAFVRGHDRCRYLGCDQSRAMVCAASEENNAFTYVIADAGNMPLANNSFQMALVSGLICCTEFWEPVVLEAFRVARKCVLLHRIPLYEEGDDITVLTQDVYGTEAPWREFRTDFFVDYISKLGKITGTLVWSRGEGKKMASFLIEVEE